jgi:alkylation response protein AidB-like acyl-CoA dehydrogenase
VDFGFTDEQQEIQRTAREFLAARFTADKVRELAESGTYDDGLWGEIRELGWPGIAIAEENGGQGLGMVELAILSEELGRACAPTPFLSTAAAALLVEAAGSDEHRERLLGGLAAGERLGTVGVVDGDVAPLVPDAAEAELIVLVDGDSATLLEGEAPLEPLDAIDLTRRYSSVSANGGDPLPGDPGPAMDRVAVTLAAELTGVAQRAMDMAVEYAKERQQFGRAIGSYQAVSHRCAAMLYDVEEARSLAYYASWAADAEPESLPLAAAMAKARASDAAWSVTASALQVLGGIGFTWEHDLHFLLKRAKVGGELYGTAREHRERVAELVGLTPEPVAS